MFCTPEFLSLWWERFGREGALHAYRARDEAGALVGLVPMYAWRRRPVRVLRFLGHGAGDQLGPLAEPDRRPEVAAALLRLLAETPASLLVAEHLPRQEGWGQRLGGRRLSTEPSPVLRFAAQSWDEYLEAQSANFRQQLRRLERRLGRSHEVHYTLARTTEELERGLDALFALHRARWSSETSFGQRERFHREFAARALERGWARLWLLELDGRPVAAWYGLRFAGAECYYQMGRDPAWDRSSVGSVLLVHSVREAFADGMTEYRFLRGGESYKYRFTSEDPGLENVLVARGPVAPAVHSAVRAARVLRQTARAARRRVTPGRGRPAT